MKDTDIHYNKELKKFSVNEVNGETKYYIGAAKICPKCKGYIVGHPALSRVDNRTEICSDCGLLEALEAFINYKNEETKNVL